MSSDRVRVAAMADLHCNVSSRGAFQKIFVDVNEKADVLALCGDLTDYGLPEEADILAGELSVLNVPVVAVLGNHDFQSNRANEVRQRLVQAKVNMLDGEAVELKGVGFAGVKGFAGGFGKHALQPWGEQEIKHFVNTAVQEAVKLESALAKLRTSTRIALMHYSPVLETIIGEPVEIFPYLGSARLEDPLERHAVTAAFHGHAHHGALVGKTRGQIPVYNVALPLLRRLFPDKSPFHVIEVQVEQLTHA